jgi:hypothetical protein
VTLEHPIHGEIDRLEREWCRSREPVLMHWDWRVIARSFAEHFMLRVEDVPVAIWAATPPAVTGGTYTLQFLEIGPGFRGLGVWGVFALDVICARAAESGAAAVVLAAMPERVPWYRRYGAVDATDAWVVEDGLAPMTIQEQCLKASTERLDGFREEEEEAT